jgi:hypothetical protein
MISYAGNGEGEHMEKYKPATEKELAAIEAVKAAIKALPRALHMSVDDSDGVVEFWKAHSAGGAHGFGTPLRCKAAFNNTYNR